MYQIRVSFVDKREVCVCLSVCVHRCVVQNCCVWVCIPVCVHCCTDLPSVCIYLYVYTAVLYRTAVCVVTVGRAPRAAAPAPAGTSTTRCVTAATNSATRGCRVRCVSALTAR